MDGVRAETRANATTDGKAVVAEGLQRAALQPWQRELLHVAFEAASRFPTEPHWKNRGRAQDVVVAACFQLEQPELARSYGERIGDWPSDVPGGSVLPTRKLPVSLVCGKARM